MLKTDDDCYVRLHRVLDALHEAPAKQAQQAKQDQSMSGLAAAMSKQLGKPMHTDGLQLYNAKSMVDKAAKGGGSGGSYIDDAEGRAVSVSDLGAAAAAKQGGGSAQEQQAAAAGAGAAAPLGRLRLSGVYLGCIENHNGFYPIRDPTSKW